MKTNNISDKNLELHPDNWGSCDEPWRDVTEDKNFRSPFVSSL